jgi:hypothetical protein
VELLGLAHHRLGGQRRAPVVVALFLEEHSRRRTAPACGRTAEQIGDRAPGRLADQVQAGDLDRREDARILADQDPQPLQW